jgi:hypothetical protein
MKYWLMTLVISLLWVIGILGTMWLHAAGDDALLRQKYVQLALCGFLVIWAFASFLRIIRKSAPPK